MDVEEAAAAVTALYVLDVREYYEWAEGHIGGAVHLPLRHLPDRIGEIPRDRPVLVTCQIGQRSAVAAELLRGKGFDAHNLEGGVESWVDHGLVLEDASGGPGKIVDGWAQTLGEAP